MPQEVARLQGELAGAGSCWDPLGAVVQGQLAALLAERAALSAANAQLAATVAALHELLGHLRPGSQQGGQHSDTGGEEGLASGAEARGGLGSSPPAASSPRMHYSYLVSPPASPAPAAGTSGGAGSASPYGGDGPECVSPTRASTGQLGGTQAVRAQAGQDPRPVPQLASTPAAPMLASSIWGNGWESSEEEWVA